MGLQGEKGIKGPKGEKDDAGPIGPEGPKEEDGTNEDILYNSLFFVDIPETTVTGIARLARQKRYQIRMNILKLVSREILIYNNLVPTK